MSIFIGPVSGKRLLQNEIPEQVPRPGFSHTPGCVKYSFEYLNDRYLFFAKIEELVPYMHDASTRTALMNTAERMYNLIGYGIFVVIQNGAIKSWYPFANQEKVKPGTEHLSAEDLGEYMEKKSRLDDDKIRRKYLTRSTTAGWSLSQCIMFYWEDWWKGKELYVNIYYDMISNTLSNRADKVKDCVFFINLFDQPVITKSVCNYYVHEETLCSLSEVNENAGKFITVFSGATTKYHQDACMVYADAWEIASHKKFDPKCRDWYSNTDVTTDWNKKLNKIVFRGRNSSCHPNDPDKNPRIKVLRAFREIESEFNKENEDAGSNFFDVGFSDYTDNVLVEYDNFTSSDPSVIESFVGPKKHKMSMIEQSKCRFVLDIDGYVTPWRLVFELSYGSCIILIKSKYYSWFYDKLEHMKNVVIIDQDLEFDALKQTILRTLLELYQNQSKAREIGANARRLYADISRADSVYDYMVQALNQTVA